MSLSFGELLELRDSLDTTRKERQVKFKQIKPYGSKKFLTPGTDSLATGAICTYVSSGYDIGVDASVQVKDCSRGVTLEFSVYSSQMTKPEIKKMVKKIDVMINELVKFKEAFQKATDIALENKVTEALDKSQNP